MMTATVDERPMPASPGAMLHASNLLTYVSLFLALGAVVAALWYQSAHLAGAAIAASVITDTFDGRFARRFTRTVTERDFGVQLDSLVDAVCAGVAPVVVTAALLRPSGGLSGAIWVIGAFIYVVGAVTRLGFYNLTHEDTDSFIGLPAPVASMFVATMLIWPLSFVAMSTLLFGAGLAMMGGFRVPRPRGLGLALFALWPIVVILVHIL
ncbi:MAG: CDP-alcohol phosphatidyltransferase family protein [bacterium]